MPSGRGQSVAIPKAIYSRFGVVQVTDRAAAVSYHGILSLFDFAVIWLWLGNLASLVGALFNAETYRVIGEA